MLQAAVTSRDLKTVRDFFRDRAPTCVHGPEGMLKYRYVIPTYAAVAGQDDASDVPERSLTGHYLQMYDWDACFFSQAAHRVGVDGLARDVVANFLSLKEKDGYVPRTISPQRIWDQGDMCKPFLVQALVREWERQGGKPSESFGQYIQDLDCYLSYFRRHRRYDSGLYHWRNVLESGVDDNLALLYPLEASKDENENIGDFPDGRIVAVDACSYLAVEFSLFSKLARAHGKTELADDYAGHASALVDKIEADLWNEKLGMYCNLDPGSGNQVALRSWTGLTPVLMGIARPERAEQAIRTNILNQAHFLRPCGLPSMAVSEPLCNQSRRGLYGRAIVSNWQGPMWVLPNALAVRALLAQGFATDARELARRVVATLYRDINETGTLHENYDVETGAPLWAPKFMSWNILALELVEILE